MAIQELKICPKCKDWQYCEWVCDNEIAGEPLFSLLCCACGYTFDAEQPIILPKDVEHLPKEQMQLFPVETGVENIMNAMIARRLDWGIASMQGASDSCYECGDSIVHIDAKTILDSDGDVTGETFYQPESMSFGASHSINIIRLKERALNP